MLDVTVKTLDGQNRSFSVPEATTVKQFKDKIAGSINIATDRQRLIYQGRVLQDDKKLNEYDVHGKVIHVVQRAPPSTRSAADRSASPPPAHGFHAGMPPRDFAIGAFAVPDPVDPTQVQSIVQQVLSGMGDVGQHARVTSRTSPDGSAVDVHINLNQSGLPIIPSESQQRVNLVQRMIRLIRESLDRLENQSSGDRTPTPQGSGASTPSEGSQPGSRMEVDASASANEDGSSGGSNGNGNSSDSDGPRVQPNPQTPALSTALTELLHLQERFQPWLAQYNEVLRDDPDFEGDDDGLRNNQRVINQVSAMLHHFGHAFHSISDIMVDLSSSRPRQLRAVPAPPPPPTAVIHQTIPVQAQISVNTALAGSPRLVRRQTAAGAATRTTTTTSSSTRSSASATSQTQESRSETAAESTTATSTAVSSSTTTPTTRPVTHHGSTNPYVFMEVGPNSLSVNSISAHVFSADRQNGSSTGSTTQTTNSTSTATTATAGNTSTTPSSAFMGTPGFVTLPPGAIPLRFASMPMASAGGRVPGGAVPVTAPSGAPPEFMQGLVQMALQAAAQRMSGPGNGSTGVTSSLGTISSPSVSSSNGRTSSTASSTNGTSSSRTTTSTSTTASSGATPTSSSSPTASGNGMRIPSLMALDSRSVDPYLPCSSRHFTMVRSTRRMTDRESTVNDVVGNLVSALIGQPNPHLQGQSAGTQTSSSETNASNTSSTSTSTSSTSTSSSAPINPFAALFNAGGSMQGSNEGSGTGSTPGMSNFADRLHQILQDGRSSSTPSATPASAPSAAPSLSTGAMSDNMFAQLVSGIGSQLSQVMRGSGTGATITDFIRSMEQNYNVAQGEGLFNDLFQVIGQHMTFVDLLQVFFGHAQPLQQLHEPLQEFIRTRIMNDEETTDENINAAVERLLVGLEEQIDQSCQDPGVIIEDGIDFKTTLTDFLRYHLRSMIKMILQSSENDTLFGQCLFNRSRRFLHEAIVLCRYCLRNGMEGVDNILQSRIRAISTDVSNPMVQNWMLSMSSQQLQIIVPQIQVSDADIEHYVVRTNQRMEASPQSESSEVASMESVPLNDDVQTDSVTSTSAAAATEVKPCGAAEVDDDEAARAVEAMEVDAASTESRARNGTPSIVSSSSERGAASRRMNGDMQASSVIERDNLPDVVIGSEHWHRALPEDWIPVISRDVQTQRRQAPQAPLSDAYLNGMPAKRRKVVQKDGLVGTTKGNAGSVIPHTVKQAVAAAGVEPITNFEEIEKDAAVNSTLHSVYEEQVISDIRNRLRSDPDFSPEQFPNAEEYFKKDGKK